MPVGWEESTALSPEDTFDFTTQYNTRDSGSNSSSFQLQGSRAPLGRLGADSNSHLRPQSCERAAVSSAYVFPMSLQSQNVMNNEPAFQKPRATSPSLGYFSSAFPMSIFTDSPPKRLQNSLATGSNHSTSAQYPTPTLQDHYSIRFPLTYSPRRRRTPSSTFFESQPQLALNFNNGYDIPSGLPLSSSVQNQSTSNHTLPHFDSFTGSRRQYENVQLQQVPIAYTARLSDLKAFALNIRTQTSLVDVGDLGKNGEDAVLNNNVSLDSVPSNSSDMDEIATVGVNTIADKGELSNYFRLLLG
jgi:hypothetical protein